MKRICKDQNASHLILPHLFPSWLAQHGCCPAVPFVSVLPPFFGAHTCLQSSSQLSWSAAAARCLLSVPPISAVLHRHGNILPLPCRSADLLSAPSICTTYSQCGCLFLIAETPWRLYLMPGVSCFSFISVASVEEFGLVLTILATKVSFYLAITCLKNICFTLGLAA